MRSAPKGSGFTFKEISILVAAVVAVIALRMCSKKPEAAIPQAVSTVTTTTTLPTLNKGQIPQSIKVPEGVQTMPSSPIVERQGLCRYGDRNPVIHWRVVQLLNKKHPSMIVLPRYHGNCLINQSNFLVADYDPQADVGFDYLGNFEMKLELIHSYPDIQELLQVNKDAVTGFGFENTAEIVAWLNELGPVEKDMGIFKVQRVGSFFIRSPIGAFSTYPGVQIITPDDLEMKIKKDSSLQIIDTRSSGPVSNLKGAKRLDVTGLPKNIMPIVAVNQWKVLKDKMKLNFQSSFVLSGESEADSLPFVWASALAPMGVKEISVLKSGASDPGAPKLETPQSFTGAETIGVNRLQELINTSVVIDSRAKKDRQIGATIKDSLKIPIEKRKFLKISGNPIEEITTGLRNDKLDSKFDIFEKPKFANMLSSLKSKRMIVIGNDDYDWMPLLIIENLRRHGKSDVYWYRPGFESLEIYKKVGQPLGEFKKQLKAIHHFKRKIVQVKDAGPKQQKAIVVLQPKGPKKKQSGNLKDQNNRIATKPTAKGAAATTTPVKQVPSKTKTK